jgi:large subunit ribosomal protein L30
MKTAAKDTAKQASAKAGKKTITLRLKKGLVACNPTQRATVNGLGLKHREQVVTLENTSSVRGMVKKVLHLVDVVSQTV